MCVGDTKTNQFFKVVNTFIKLYSVTSSCSAEVQVTFLEHTSLSTETVDPAAAQGVSPHWWMILFPLPAVIHVVSEVKVIKRGNVRRNTTLDVGTGKNKDLNVVIWCWMKRQRINQSRQVSSSEEPDCLTTLHLRQFSRCWGILSWIRHTVGEITNSPELLYFASDWLTAEWHHPWRWCWVFCFLVSFLHREKHKIWDVSGWAI